MTLTRFKLKNSDVYTWRMWRDTDKSRYRYERELEYNHAIMSYLFNATMNGEIKGFHLVDDEIFRAFHRSTKEDNTIQLSAGFFRNGELIPTYDVQLHNYEEMRREGYPSGVYEVIA